VLETQGYSELNINALIYRKDGVNFQKLWEEGLAKMAF